MPAPLPDSATRSEGRRLITLNNKGHSKHAGVTEKGRFRSFTGTRSDDEVAPIPAVRGTGMEPPGSTQVSRQRAKRVIPIPVIQRLKLAAPTRPMQAVRRSGSAA
jgi:hypothetical protein